MTEDGKRRWKPPAAEGPGAKEGAAGRSLSAKAAKVRRPSSKAWVERQLNDPYVARAKAEGWRARSAYKLIQLDEKFGFIRPGARVIDLGAAPGGWAQAVLARGAARVVGVDLLPVEPLANAEFLQLDFLEPEAPGLLLAALGGAPDLVLSDMAANTTGHRATDQIKTGALAQAAAEGAISMLKPGGAFVTKAFQGGLDATLLARLKRAFASVRHAKPPASRAQSPEIYVVAQGFSGDASA